MAIETFLLSAVGTVGYDALKAAIAHRFQGDPDDLARRLATALDEAIRHFFAVYGAKFPSANRSFLGRPENLSAIGNALHYSQPPLTARDINPTGVDGGPDAVATEVDHFLALLSIEISKDRFLDKHFRERDHMREAATHIAESRELRALVEQVLRIVHAQAGLAASDPWNDLVVNDPKRAPGWVPQQGQIYSSNLTGANKIEFMLHGTQLSVQFTFGDGAEWYFDVDSRGNASNQKFPYPLSEYRIVIPAELVLREELHPLADGNRLVVKTMKWGNAARYILDAQGLLQEFHFSKGAFINHRERLIGVEQARRE